MRWKSAPSKISAAISPQPNIVAPLRVHAEISSQIRVSRRPPGKARKRRNMNIFRGFATQPGVMHRRPKCEVVSVWALSPKARAISGITVFAVGVRSARTVRYGKSHSSQGLSATRVAEQVSVLRCYSRLVSIRKQTATQSQVTRDCSRHVRRLPR